MRRISVMFFVSCFVASLSMLGQTPDRSAEIRVGATKAEVIKVLGLPKGQSKAGSKEIFSYAQGQLTFEDGRVTRVNFSANVPRQAPKPEPASAQVPPAPTGVSRWIDDARTLIITGVTAGIVIMLLLLWLLWRNWSVAQPKGSEMTRRISEAASGIPTLDEIRQWSQKTVCAVAAVMAESEGYHVDTYKLGDNADLELRRRGDTRPHALLLAVGATESVLTLDRLRDLKKEMASSQVQGGWVVAPAGFESDAVRFARKHNLTLVSGEMMSERLRDVPPLSLSAALAQTGAGRTRQQR